MPTEPSQNPTPAPALILASASPRRAELLSRAGLRFAVEVAGVEEHEPERGDPVALARELAASKARAVAARHAGEPRWVIGADTVVALPDGGELPLLLGKPADAAGARAMLEGLSGSTHAVVTGVCVIAVAAGEVHVEAERTTVHMRPIAPREVAAYVASGEWRDKAGGYAIQETADAFVTRLEGGSFDNVVGLPVALALELLERAGAPLP